MEDIIFKRRSIRLFKKQEIPEEILRKILLAGMWAPSPKNRQPWKMIAALGTSKEISTETTLIFKLLAVVSFTVKSTPEI